MESYPDGIETKGFTNSKDDLPPDLSRFLRLLEHCNKGFSVIPIILRDKINKLGGCDIPAHMYGGSDLPGPMVLPSDCTRFVRDAAACVANKPSEAA
jgi:hypothetical protein